MMKKISEVFEAVRYDDHRDSSLKTLNDEDCQMWFEHPISHGWMENSETCSPCDENCKMWLKAPEKASQLFLELRVSGALCFSTDSFKEQNLHYSL